MSISLFCEIDGETGKESGPTSQICDKCGKIMRHVLEMPAVHWKGPGSSPKSVPQGEREELVTHLENEYYDQAVHSGELDEAKDTERVRINRWRNTKTGKKIDVPVEEK